MEKIQRVPMTETGYNRLQDELKQLKTVERYAVIKAIAEARSHGDLSENAEYDAARERQGFIEGRIAELESKLSYSEIIDVSKLTGNIVRFGAFVKLVDEDTEDESSYQLVGADESDVNQGLISISAPLARSLIGKKVGDSIEVITPGGSKFYEILAVSFKPL